MGSVVSSENEGPPSLSEECGTCGHVYNWHYSSDPKKCTADDDECTCSGFKRKPKDSERSSPDEHQCCGHWVSGEHPDQCCICDADIPAAGETAGESEAPEDPSLDHLCQECPHPRRGHVHFGAERKPTCMYCTSENDAYSHEFARATPERDEQWRREAREEWARVLARKSAFSRRPPYAVAYELEDGTAYEVALPGDATVGFFQGALIISHASSPVKGLTQARPMEGQ